MADSQGNDTSGSEWSQRTSNTFDNEILFCGYRYDPETGLYHVRNRMYHPTLGRWLQRDPIGYVDGYTLYEYALGSPVLRNDATGLMVTSTFGLDRLIDWILGRERPKPPKPPTVCVKQPDYDQCLAKAKAKYDKLLKLNEDHYEKLLRKIGQDVNACIDWCQDRPPLARQGCIRLCQIFAGELKVGVLQIYLVADAVALSNWLAENGACHKQFRKEVPADCPCPDGYKEFKENIKEAPRVIPMLAAM